MPCKLNREPARGPRCAIDQNGFTRSQVRSLDQGSPSGHAAVRDSQGNK
jgi:hypothetical protein